MIPIRLYMRNFMCYREQALDFTGIHLACLTGNNGHGKSAILDALTWVLWGRSRVGARRDDELIHVGQMALNCGATVDTLAACVYNYPTLAECYKTAALDCLQQFPA